MGGDMCLLKIKNRTNQNKKNFYFCRLFQVSPVQNAGQDREFPQSKHWPKENKLANKLELGKNWPTSLR